MLPPHDPGRRAIEGHGTDEALWRSSRVLEGLGTLDVDQWPSRYARVWLIAPHPDDEVLALGGSLVGLAAAGSDLRIVSVTDGEASHGQSKAWSRERLAATRPTELKRALVTLGVQADVMRLGLPDGRVGAHRDALLKSLGEVVAEDDLLLTTCRFDGHPDHEACGEVADLVGQLTGATVFEYPVWMWHWARPDESTIPWNRARRLPVPADAMARKRSAIGEFVSQITPDGTQDPVLPAHVLPRFLRPFEIVFA